MRGKDQAGDWAAKWEGITPAYAGKRQVKIPYQNGTGDHPRVCGEK